MHESPRSAYSLKMMKELEIYSAQTISPLLNDRVGEEILGNRLHFIDADDDLKENLARVQADYVLFGIPEDIGVRANYGRPGASQAWNAAMKRFLNVQINPDNDMAEVILLGHLDFSELENEIQKTGIRHPSELGPYVERIDAVVAQLVEIIVGAGKIPIAVGGGHNNAYGMLKGTSAALSRSVNAINIDAHADLRPMDYRHSGNGFTYALNENLLNRYFIFGLHENYNSQAIYSEINSPSNKVDYISYEAMYVRQKTNLESEINRALEFVGADSFGLELDMDCIAHLPSSALTPSGLSAAEARRLTHVFASSPQLRYVHICEAAPKKENDTEEIIVGKLICYLLTDILRAGKTSHIKKTS